MGRQRRHARCSKVDTLGTRCKTLIPLANLLQFPRSGGFPLYCDLHEREILAEMTMGTTPFGGKRLRPWSYESVLMVCSIHPELVRTAHPDSAQTYHAQAQG